PFWWDNYGENKRVFGSGTHYAVHTSNPSLVRRFRKAGELTKLSQVGLLIDSGIYDMDWLTTGKKADANSGSYFIPGGPDTASSGASAFGFHHEITQGRHPDRAINIVYLDAHADSVHGKTFQLRAAAPTAATDPLWNPQFK